MINETQYRKLIEVFNKSGEISMSSLKAGIDRKTGAKYINGGQGPSERKVPHTWRTRPDPFADVAGEIDEMLGNADGLKPLTIFMHLQEKYPGKFHDGQLRTLERRVREWMAQKGRSCIVSIPQVHLPGKLMELDWTCMNELMVTVCGVHFKHLLCHSILTYSNWEWAEIAHSESFSSLKKGFQSAIFRLGAVPEILQTDNSSTATHQIKKDGRERTFNYDYTTFLEHYGVKPRSINVNSPDENGDIESANGHLKKRMEQHLLLRGSGDFQSVDEYRLFLTDVLEKANRNRMGKAREEIQVMRELPAIRLPEYTEEEKTVSAFGTVRVKKVAYSVPSRLKGYRVRLRVYEDRIEMFAGQQYIETLTRKSGLGYSINYGHVIESLRRKPGAFSNCRYRDQMFPRESFSMAYEQLLGRNGERLADREYLEILELAVSSGEEKVSDILVGIMGNGEKISMDAVKIKLNIPMRLPEINRDAPTLFSYDSLLHGGV